MSRWLVATMTSVLFVALVVAVTGFEALLADVEPIRQPDATPYLGPAMVLGGAVVVFLATGTGARTGNPGVSGLVAAAATYLVMLGVGAVGYALVRSDATQLLVFPAGAALGQQVLRHGASWELGFVGAACELAALGLLLVATQRRKAAAREAARVSKVAVAPSVR